MFFRLQQRPVLLMQEKGAEPNLLYHKKYEDRNHLLLFFVTFPSSIPSP